MQNSKVSGQTSPQAVKAKGSILMAIVLIGALSVVPATNVNAQVQCLGKCEQQLALCIGSGGEDPGGCVTAYEVCVEKCLGNTFTALFG